MAQEWKRLPLGRHETCPPLFFRFNRSSKGYEISLTDLVYIWSESLNHKEVLTRASNIETSIDPSEDEDQFSILLQKVEDALRGAKGSTISLKQSKNEHGLDLSTTTKLPTPLEPLEWILRLSRLPQNALTRQILIPILKGEANRAARTQSLIGLLKEKDTAMSKIFDKIESSGLDISRTFPGLSAGRGEHKGSALAQVSKVVKGVAPFDERAWSSSFATGESGDPGLNFASELDSVHSYRDWDAVQSNLLEEWWVRLESEASLNNKSKAKPARNVSPKRPQQPVEDDEATASDTDDEFQRQETPPRSKAARTSTSVNREKDQRTKSPGNQLTESDSESEFENAKGSPSPSPPSQKPQPARKGSERIGARSRKSPTPRVEESTASESEELAPPPKAKDKSISKGLGSIGGRKSRPAPRPAADSTASDNSDSDKSTKGAAPPADVPTASDSEENERPPSSRKRKEPEPIDDSTEGDSESDVQTSRKKPQKSRIGGLGQIGGKKGKEQKPDDKRASPESDDESANQSSASPPSPKPKPKPKRIGKLGTIGGGKPSRKPIPSQKEAEETASGTDSDTGAAQIRKTSSPLKKLKKEEETSQEQAEIPPTSRSRFPPGTRRSAWPKEEENKEVKEETPEERANRKREELRRKIETKGPAKKKRRF